MDEQVIHIIYPPSLLKKPIINDLIRKYQQLQINILRADISLESAWLEIQILGNSALIEDAINWMRVKGIEVRVSGA